MQFPEHATWQVPLISFHDAATFCANTEMGSHHSELAVKMFRKSSAVGKVTMTTSRERCNNIKNRIHGTKRENSQQKTSVKGRIRNCEFSLWKLPKWLQHLESARRWKTGGTVYFEWKNNHEWKCFIFPHVFLRKALFSIPPVADKNRWINFSLSLKFLFYFLINVLRAGAIDGACYRHLLLFEVLLWCFEAAEWF